MIKEIKYSGYSATPSDYKCPDGDLSLALGLIQENGSLSPVPRPRELFLLDVGSTVVHLHSTSHYRHYIILTSAGTLQWCDVVSPSVTVSLRTFAGTIHQVTSIGNTLIVLASDGMHYFLWQGVADGYLYLGTEIPECPLSFGLQGEMIRGDEFSITFNSISEGDIWNEFSDANKTKVTSQVLAKVNKFIADHSTNKGKFIYPFLLRYAYRLYDGSLTKHSAPILMVASSDLAPQVFYTHISGKGSYTSATLQVVGLLHKVDYAAVNQSYLSNLQNWKDIIRSVDIFVSKPIYTYDQSGECSGFQSVDESDCYSICKHVNQSVSTTDYPLRYQYNEFSKLYAFTFNPTTFEYPLGRLLLPRRSVDEVKSDIKNCSQFYFLESIKIEQLTMERTPITVEEDYLQSLVTREVMTDDYDSHDKIIPQYSFPYNSRLNLSNLRKSLFKGHNPYSLYPYSNGYVQHYTDATPTITDYTESLTIYVYIKHSGRDICVVSDSGLVGYKSPLLFFYYPNINAYKAVVYRRSYGRRSYYELRLEQHSFLNGAFYFGGWDDVKTETTSIPSESSDAERTIDVPNKIYTSEVNNPFYFPLLGITTVGTGRILGISSAAKALSSGQFGQFPLYAFTTEGVWALEVSGTGTYTAKQPITRDVVLSPSSITQIDSAVLFATDRGIMHLSGSTAECITDVLNGPASFLLSHLPKCDNLISVFNNKATASDTITLDDVTLIPFNEFLQRCQMLYDYPHQRLIVYNPSVRYAYVYSFKSHHWGLMYSDLSSSVNSYPESLAMTLSSRLVDFSQSDDSSPVTSLLVTRPFSLDAPDTHKTIISIIQRGMFRSTHVQQVLYGTNDLIHWYPVWSSVDNIMRGFRGSPYKAFCIVLVCTFDKDESIYGCSVVYEPRMTNQVR